MQIYLMNERHGKKIAYAEAEALADIRNGWKVCSENEYYGTSKEENIEVVEEKSIPETVEEDAPIVSKTSKKRKPKAKL